MFQELLPAFCNAYEDPAILGDARVLANMLWVEAHYVPAPPSLCYGPLGTQVINLIIKFIDLDY